MRAWWVVVVAWCTSGCAVHRFECERHGGTPVVRIESEHFSVTSDLQPQEARGEAQRLERLWTAFGGFFQSAPEPRERLSVLLTRDEALQEFVPDSPGFVTQGLSPLMVTTGEPGARGPESSIAPDFVHLMSRHWLPMQPRWISEGLAELLGDAHFVSESVVHFGRSQWEGGLVEPLLALWAWGEARGTEAEEHSHRKSAWAWLHYLASRDGVRLAQLWKALAAGDAPRAAFESVFPLAQNTELQASVQRYVDEGHIPGLETTLLGDPTVGTPVAVAPWEVHLLRREVARATGWAALARTESGVANTLAPAPRPAEVSIAVALDTLRGPDLTDELLKLPVKPLMMLELGFAVDGSPYFQLHTLQRATAALPNSARAHLGLARAAVRIGDPGALGAAQRAARLAPWSVEARIVEARALAKSSRCGEALAVVSAAASLNAEQGGWGQAVAAARRELLASCPEAK